MGMAASQARLLTITARIHDVEYQAQSIQNAKVQLATQSDQVYQEYLEALDATTLTVKDYEGNIITANFNNLWGMNAVDTGNQYALFSSNGSLIVSDEEKDAYDEFKSEVGTDDPYAFAMFMLDGGFYSIGATADRFCENIADAENQVFEEYASDDSKLTSFQEGLQETIAEFATKSGAETTSYEDMVNNLNTFEWDDATKKELKALIEKYQTYELSFKNRLYSQHAEEIYSKAGGDSIDFDQDKFNYYVELYKKIQAAGGNCISIEDYDDSKQGDVANNSEWLKNMIQCGKITIDTVNIDSKTGEVSFTGTSPSSDTYLDYTTTTSIDKTAYAKAEAEYEHATKEIDAKDKKYDMDLSKLETERTALTTEYESVKKVISDNIERTFGIFS